MTNSPASYSVSIWEAIAITLGAVALTLVGIGGLSWKDISDPKRSEAIARSILTYDIPGGSKGVLGINFGGARIALVNSLKHLPKTNYPQLQMIVAKVAITPQVNKEFTTEKIDLKAF